MGMGSSLSRLGKREHLSYLSRGLEGDQECALPKVQQ